MEIDQIKQVANILHIQDDVANEFINSLTSSELAALVNNLENGDDKEIHSQYEDYEYYKVAESLRSKVFNEMDTLFEGMKNKWKKRSYWRERPNNKGLGTVGVEEFDFPKEMNRNPELEVDDYGTIKLKESIVNNSKKKI